MTDHHEKTITPPPRPQRPPLPDIASLAAEEPTTPDQQPATAAPATEPTSAATPTPVAAPSTAASEVITPEGTQNPPQAKRAAVTQPSSSYPFLKTFILAFPLGLLGADRFYLGYKQLGIAKLLTLGGLGVWMYVDAILILLGKMTSVDGESLEGRREHFNTAVIIFAVITLLIIILTAAILPLYLWGRFA